MCERTKAQVLARNLSYIFHYGFSRGLEECGTYKGKSLSKCAEEYWEGFLPEAEKILEVLDKHDN